MKLKKTLGAGVLSLGLVVGLAGFAGAASGTIGTTGPNSNNEISHESDMDWDVRNDNDLDLGNTNNQAAVSGEVTARGNTTAGDAHSGDAANSNAVEATVEFDNSGAAAGLGAVATPSGSDSASIENTGPRSNNEVTYESNVDVSVDNDNTVDITNTNTQSAASGSATVRGNTTGGNAMSGSVSNTSSSSFNVRVTN